MDHQSTAKTAKIGSLENFRPYGIFLTIVTSANCAVLYIQRDLVHLRIHCTFQQRRVEDSTEGESGGPRLDGQQGGDCHEYQLPTVSYGDCAEAEEGWLPSPSSLPGECHPVQ